MEASHPEPGTLHAWIESELDSAEHERVAAHIAECARCQEVVAEARGLIAGASRIVAALDDAPAGVIPRRLRRSRFVPARWAAAAAVLLFAAMSVVVSREFRSTDSDLPTAAVETAVPSEELENAPAPTLPAPAPASSAAGDLEGSRRAAITTAAPGARTLSRQDDGRREVRDRVVAEPAAPIVRNVPIPDRATTESVFGAKDAEEVAGITAPAAAAVPHPAPPAPPPPSASTERPEVPSVERVRELAGRAVALSSEPRVLRVVRYEAQLGVLVTLTEYEEQPQRAAARAGAAAPMRAQADAVRPQSSDTLTGSGFAGNVYVWRHPDGRRFYTLQGPLPQAELESLARRLGELKVVR